MRARVVGTEREVMHHTDIRNALRVRHLGLPNCAALHLALCFGLSALVCMAQESAALEWVEATDTTPWPKRAGHTCVVHDGYLWLIGGEFDPVGTAPPQYFGEVWRSEDGVEWTLVTRDVPWNIRSGHTTEVFAGKMWIIGGNEGGLWY